MELCVDRDSDVETEGHAERFVKVTSSVLYVSFHRLFLLCHRCHLRPGSHFTEHPKNFT